MSSILVSLQSQLDNSGALAVLAPDSGLRYLQIDKPASVIKMVHPRRFAVLDDLVYVNTAASLCIYRLVYRHKTALLQLQNEVILQEWLLGEPAQANLVALAISEQEQRIFIGNNQFCAIDELDLAGKFIGRRHLWEIAPEIFPLPHRVADTMCYGVIRNIIFSPDGPQYLVIANCNNSGQGKIINLQTGQEHLSGLNDPHDGILHNDLLYLHDVDQGKYFDKTNQGILSVYRLNEKKRFVSVAQWPVRSDVNRPDACGDGQKLRGMALVGNTLYCGLSHFGPLSGKESLPSIVSFNAKTGTQEQEYQLPDLLELRQPRVFSMAAVPDFPPAQWSRDLHFFLYGKETAPQFYHEEVEPTTEEEETVDSCSVEGAGPDKDVDRPPDEVLIAEEAVLTPAKEKIPSVILDHVSLKYRRTGATFLTWGRNRHLRQTKEFLALQDLSFTLYEGETVGLIGRNGSGKSTLSMVISGALPSDGGKTVTYGKVQLLALGVGFRPEMTGRDNVFISGTLLGLSRRDVAGRMDDIKEFSELGDFFDEPLRTYSSGMRSRLGFAVATAVRPDILILDEVMSTGDAAFRQKADKRMLSMREHTKTVIIVSHNANQLKKNCSRVIWLEKGELIMDGEAKSVLKQYDEFCQTPQEWLKHHAEEISSLAADEVQSLAI